MASGRQLDFFRSSCGWPLRAEGHFANATKRGFCSAEKGKATAKFEGQSVTCTACDTIKHCASGLSCSSTDDEMCKVCDAGHAGAQCQHSHAVTCGGHGEAQPDGKCVCDAGHSGDNCGTAALCAAPAMKEEQAVLEGCEADAEMGAKCRLTCAVGHFSNSTTAGPPRSFHLFIVLNFVVRPIHSRLRAVQLEWMGSTDFVA